MKRPPPAAAQNGGLPKDIKKNWKRYEKELPRNPGESHDAPSLLERGPPGRVGTGDVAKDIKKNSKRYEKVLPGVTTTPGRPHSKISKMKM